MRVLLNGIGGKMGGEVIKACERGYGGAELIGGIDVMGSAGVRYLCTESFNEAEELFGRGKADCLIDFSHRSVTGHMLDYACRMKLPTVIATTGHGKRELDMIRCAAEKIPIFFSANTSLGIAFLSDIALQAARTFKNCDVEIIEKHHKDKADIPSGTAIMLADGISKLRGAEASSVKVHSLRMGNIAGEHEIIFCTDSQTVTLSHKAHDRSLYAEGAIDAAGFIIKQRRGLYSMQDMIKYEMSDGKV